MIELPHVGDDVTVTAEAIARRVCRVEAISEAAEVPYLPKFPASIVRSVISDWMVTRIMLLSYPFHGKRYIFAVVEVDGRWLDLSRQELTIRPGRLRRAS